MENDRLNIALLSIHSCPLGRLGSKDTGGMSVYVIETARRLAELGHRVDIFTRSHEPTHGEVIKLGSGVRLIHLNPNCDFSVSKNALINHIDKFVSALDRFRRQENLTYDLIHSHYWLSGLTGLELSRMWAVPHVTMFHTLGAVKNRMGPTKDEPESRISSEKRIIMCCDRIIAATDRETGELERYYNANPDIVRVIPCGVNLGLFRPLDKQAARASLGLADRDEIVLFVGRIDPLKGIERLLAAIGRLDRPRLKLVIVGGDGESEDLLNLSRSHGLGQQLIPVGRVDQPELAAYYSASDLLAVPSYHESFGLVALEALACGAPVMAADVGGLRDFISPGLNGCLIAQQPDQEFIPNFADGLQTVLDQVRSGMLSRKAIRGSVIGYDWPTAADALADQYQDLVADWPARSGGWADPGDYVTESIRTNP